MTNSKLLPYCRIAVLPIALPGRQDKEGAIDYEMMKRDRCPERLSSGEVLLMSLIALLVPSRLCLTDNNPVARPIQWGRMCRAKGV